MSDDFNKMIELIDSVKAATEYSEIELIGNKESFRKLMDLGFPLDGYRHQEVSCIDESKIIIIPCESRFIKVYFEKDVE